jgi:hypothetical protein
MYTDLTNTLSPFVQEWYMGNDLFQQYATFTAIIFKNLFPSCTYRFVQ